jgi:predicted metal-dependent hydrolase
VILHELAHLRHMNHSPRFWNELCRLDPLAREWDRWLTETGEAVMALGRKVKPSAS